MPSLPTLQRAFADVLKTLRTEAGLSQQQLALESDLDRTYISLLERGMRQPSLGTIFRIATVLKVAPHEIVTRVERRSKRN